MFQKELIISSNEESRIDRLIAAFKLLELEASQGNIFLPKISVMRDHKGTLKIVEDAHLSKLSLDEIKVIEEVWGKLNEYSVEISDDSYFYADPPHWAGVLRLVNVPETR